MTSMRVILVSILALAGLSGSVQQVLAEPGEPEQETFLISGSDIPLMSGLTPDEAASVFFDKPGGRIMIARPSGCIDPQEAQRFYGITLPQLGWLPAPQAISKLTYLREGERLTLEFVTDSSGDCSTLGLILSPAPKDE